MNQIITIFKIPELRKKIFITLIFLAVYRIGFYIPLPMVDQVKLGEKLANAQNGALGQVLGFVSMFSGGNLSQACIFSMGIMPYISASIIIQLLASGVLPSLERLRKEGESGRKKLNEITRYLTVPICIIQAIIVVNPIMRPEGGDGSGGFGTAAPGYADGFNLYLFGFAAVLTITCGTVFLMWLGEQIDEYGLGNGISLIILAGIVSRMPSMVFMIREQMQTGSDSAGGMNVGKILFLMASFVFVVFGCILITQAQRRIPIQQAKHTRGRRIYGGQRQFLPLRVNHGGVMPIIFAQSLMLFPGLLLDWLHGLFPGNVTLGFVQSEMRARGFLFTLLEIILIYFFAYFWTTVQFQPKEMANQLRDYGSFIPGLRPGKRTADYLEKVMMRITYVGGAFLCIIAVIPTAISNMLQVNAQITSFLGGTGLLIVVSVALDMVQRIEANLLMRNYGGFLSGGPGQKGKRIKGRQY